MQCNLLKCKEYKYKYYGDTGQIILWFQVKGCQSFVITQFILRRNSSCFLSFVSLSHLVIRLMWSNVYTTWLPP